MWQGKRQSGILMLIRILTQSLCYSTQFSYLHTKLRYHNPQPPLINPPALLHAILPPPKSTRMHIVDRKGHPAQPSV